MMWTALPITSAGRFSPLGPFGIEVESSTTRRRVNGEDRGAGNQTETLPSDPSVVDLGGWCRSAVRDVLLRHVPELAEEQGERR